MDATDTTPADLAEPTDATTAEDMPSAPTADEKRAKVGELLESPAWSRRSDRAVAAQAGVSPPTVAKVRRELRGDPEPVRDGSDIAQLSAAQIHHQLEAISRSWMRVVDAVALGTEPEDALVQLEARRRALEQRLPVAEAIAKARRSQAERMRTLEQRAAGRAAIEALEEVVQAALVVDERAEELDAAHQRYMAVARARLADVVDTLPADGYAFDLDGPHQRVLQLAAAVEARLALAGLVSARPARTILGENRRDAEVAIQRWAEGNVAAFSRAAKRRLPNPDEPQAAPQNRERDARHPYAAAAAPPPDNDIPPAA